MLTNNTNLSNLTSKLDDYNSLIRLIADSGATENMTHSRLIFKSLDENNKLDIKCANKNSNASFRSEGVGHIQAIQNNKQIELNRVICAEALSETLLSLRRFVDQGLKIYLDNERINVLDPISNKIFISGIYKKPYWIVELDTNKNSTQNDPNNRKILAYVARYNTRSVTARKMLENPLEILDNQNFETNTNKSLNNEQIVPETMDQEEIANLNNQIEFNSEPNDLEIPSDLNFESDMQCKELPDFEHTLRDRKINIWSETIDDEKNR